MFLKHQMKDAIGYFIEKVNEPLVKAIVILGGRYPEPTRENVVHPNSRILLDIQDGFFEHWEVEARKPLLEALFRILIVKYEHSPTWRNMLDWFIKEILDSDWKPWNPHRQMKCWKENVCQ